MANELPAQGPPDAAAGGPDDKTMPTMKAAAVDEPHVQDAAMSLCALGRSRSPSPGIPSGDVPNHGQGSAPSAASGDPMQLSEAVPALPPVSSSASAPKTLPAKAARPSAKHAPRPRDPKRDTSVPFDEMKRLMRVYGPLRCLRNRTPVDSGRSAKVESVKRKFYRWFPDLDERFERTEEGWYRPKAGHEEEMQYREACRKNDQESLVKKRNSRRASAKVDVNALKEV